MKKIFIFALIATLLTGCAAKQLNENSGSITETTTAIVSTAETTANSTTDTAITTNQAQTTAVTTSKANETAAIASTVPTKTSVNTTTVPMQTTAKKVITTTAAPSTTIAPIKTSIPVTTSENASNSDTATFKQQVVDLVNAERAKAGLNPLSIMPEAAASAQIRASEIISSFSHTRPNGTSCFTALDEQGAKYNTCGENIAAGQATPADVMNSWMNSPGHKANILNPNFTKIGVGFAKGGSYGTNWTQMFVG